MRKNDDHLNLSFSREEMKAILKEAIKEWLDQVASDFGRASFKWGVSAIISVIVLLYLRARGIY